MTRLSYVIPAYNRAGVLAEAAESVLIQLRDGDEVVIVDDGSADDTPLVMRQLAARWGQRLQTITQPNGGPGAARNTGMAAARGDWIGFLDSDDLLLPGAVEVARSHAARAVEALDRFPSGPGVDGLSAAAAHLVDSVEAAAAR